MALDTENSPKSPSKQRPVLRTRNVCQKPIASAPYTKPTSTYLMGTTLDSNNPAVIRRNARERNRVKQVNNGFYVLRQHIPNTIIAEVSNGRRGIGPGAHKKLSKVDTLRMAAEYIRRLKRLINEVDSSDTSSVSSWESAASLSPAPQFNNPECHQYYSINSTSHTPDYENNSEYAQSQQISPANSVVSSVYSADSYYSDDHHQVPNQQRLQQQQQQSLTSVSVPNSTPVKFEPIFDDYNFNNNNNNSTDDEELLEYISLWQDE